MDSYHRLAPALFIVTFSVLHFVQAQDQSGFISLDCGLPPNESPYTEPLTGLNFSSDSDFIQSGKGGRIGKEWAYLSYSYKPYDALRYFPDGIRNCYNLSVKQGINYLIRAGFAYGNYDGLIIYPRFDIYVGPNLWTTVYERYQADYEIIHTARSNFLQICLVKTGTTIPFISTLELRPLRNDSYSTQTGSLQLVSRLFYKNRELQLRYPDDVHDRKWASKFLYNTKEINTTLTVNSSNPFGVPELIAMSAETPKNASETLSFFVETVNPSDKVLIYLHFAEIQELQANDTREFDIMWDRNITISAYSPKKFQIDTLFNIVPKICSRSGCDLKLVRTQRSTLPPLLNAMEVYTIAEFPYSETYQTDVTAMKNIQAAYGLNMPSWQGDPCVPELFKWKGVECSYANKSIPPRIISLDLRSRGLNGIIALDLKNLSELQRLDLSNNSLSGGVPQFLATMKSLTIINLSWNNLKGRVPKALHDRKKKGLQLLIQGNSKLCEDELCEFKNKKIFVPVVVSITGLLLSIALVVLIFVFKKKKPPKAPNQQRLKPFILKKKRRFTYLQLQAMTNNFGKVIGEGGFGIVYHGSLSDTEQVAVKLLSQSSTQGYKQFKAEVELLLRVHHINLVSLLGYCVEGDHLALVYEYTANGDLKQHLSGEQGGSTLNWANRLKIAVDIAQGLEYLHTGCRPPIMHRDVKTTNIIIDEHFHAKLVDFGLSRSFQTQGDTYISTVVAGTPGYLDPEYNQTNWLTEKSDVYSFGIVLLEMITNKPVIDQNRENRHLAEWMGIMLTKGGIENVVDPSLVGDYDSRSMWKVLELAMSCVNPSSAGRPSMSHIVKQLKECLVYENSKKGHITEVESKSSFEESIDFTAEV